MGHVCPWWHAYTFDNPLRRLIHNPSAIVGEHVGEGMRVLDLGCGMGFFSIAMARMVGDSGLVIAVDLQQKMLDVLMRRATRAGVASRIRPHRCEADRIGLEDEVDFALAFWMLHETPDAGEFAAQVRGVLRPGRQFMVAEPAHHVWPKHFERLVDSVQAAGFRECGRPRVRFSRAALFERAE